MSLSHDGYTKPASLDLCTAETKVEQIGVVMQHYRSLSRTGTGGFVSSKKRRALDLSRVLYNSITFVRIFLPTPLLIGGSHLSADILPTTFLVFDEGNGGNHSTVKDAIWDSTRQRFVVSIGRNRNVSAIAFRIAIMNPVTAMEAASIALPFAVGNELLERNTIEGAQAVSRLGGMPAWR